MADEKVVPTGPQGAVRVTDDNSKPVRFSGQNPDPRDNTPTAEQVRDREQKLAERNAQKNPDDVERDSDGTPKFGGGGTKLRFERDYWPAQQPENKVNKDDIDPATGKPRVPLVHREHRVRAGEVASVPGDEANDLLEQGIAKRVRN